ncbi:hypothetical protein AH02_37 [Pseudomonas phage AH02]|nr:hypothetical protein AH02_37 [Pseudomonas phage AH02]
MNIISSQFTGIFTALQNIGVDDFSLIRWERSPVRINGIWHAKVIL